MSKSIPALKKNHHDFLNALEKDTKSVKKPLQEYIHLLKEINAQYDKLVPHAESLNKNSVTFVLDQGTKYETKMDDDAIQKIADAYSDNLSPIIQSAIAEVIDSITATPVYKSDKTLQQITFDAAVGSI
jgi:predicted transcriptional regulator